MQYAIVYNLFLNIYILHIYMQRKKKRKKKKRIIQTLTTSLQLLHLKGRRQGLNQLLSLTSIVNDEGVQVPRTPDLKLGLSEGLTGSVQLLVDLDGSGLDVCSSGQFQELLDIGDFLGHFL